MSFDQIELENVANSFPELINTWCQFHCKCRKCKKEKECGCKECQKMCSIAIANFKGYFSPDYIRKHIRPQFKLKYRRINARIGFFKKLGILESEVKQNLYQTKIYQENGKK